MPNIWDTVIGFVGLDFFVVFFLDFANGIWKLIDGIIMNIISGSLSVL